MQYLVLFFLAVLVLALLILSHFPVSGGGGEQEPQKLSLQVRAPYTREQVKKLTEKIQRSFEDFLPLREEKLVKLKRELPDWDEEQIVSLWHTLATWRNIKASRRVAQLPRGEILELTAGNLLAKARSLKLPPLALARRLLRERGVSVDSTPSSLRDPALASLLSLAWEKDSENPTSARIKTDKSRAWELEVEALLKEQGVKFLTQEELAEEQMKKHGRAVITPDFLFPRPLLLELKDEKGGVSHHVVHWLEVKNYLYTEVEFLTKSVKKQVARYREEFGPGAVLFHYGYLDSLQIPGTLFLSIATCKKIKLARNMR